MSNITEERQPGEPLLRPISRGAIRFNYLDCFLYVFAMPTPLCLLLKIVLVVSFQLCTNYVLCEANFPKPFYVTLVPRGLFITSSSTGSFVSFIDQRLISYVRNHQFREPLGSFR
ncbi:hypothetical protein J3E69DRAFT_268363 [Trichoderma sp. SZMC 28015]